MACAVLLRTRMSAAVKTSASVSSSNPRFLWNEIVRWSFEACILRKEGREERVTELLQDRLPSLIRAWSSHCGLSAPACKEQLRSLFVRVQENVEIGFVQRRLIVEEICARFSGPAPRADARPAPAPSGSVGLRRRVPFGNIPDMLDALADAEFEAMGEAVLPLRRAVLLPSPDPFSEESAAQVALSA
jgi:hypothetical protein